MRKCTLRNLEERFMLSWFPLSTGKSKDCKLMPTSNITHIWHVENATDVFYFYQWDLRGISCDYSIRHGHIVTDITFSLST